MCVTRDTFCFYMVELLLSKFYKIKKSATDDGVNLSDQKSVRVLIHIHCLGNSQAKYSQVFGRNYELLD